MPCAACAAKAAFTSHSVIRTAKAYRTQEDQGPCDYTLGMINNFHDKLIWFKDKALYKKYNIPAKKINKYLGDVKSALNTTKICLFRKELESVSDLVDFIVTIDV